MTRERILYQKTCRVCGKEFETPYRTKTLCSPECKRASQKKYSFERRGGVVWAGIPRECEFCGKEFVPSGKYQKYCSPKCRSDQNTEERRIREGRGEWFLLGGKMWDADKSDDPWDSWDTAGVGVGIHPQACPMETMSVWR